MKNQSGNVLFLILIAVALFAALSYAVTQSNRGGGEIDKEATEIKASQFLQYAASIKYAIGRMKLINGCDDTEITFYNTPSNPECGIFHPDGGSVPYKDLPETCCGAPRDSVIEGFDIPVMTNSCGGSGLIHLSLGNFWIKGIGEDFEQDLVLMACGEDVQKLCDVLDLPDAAVSTQFNVFNGSYSSTGSTPFVTQMGFAGGPAAETLIGQDIACFSSGDSKRLYITVLER